MLITNKENLVKLSVAGEIAPPLVIPGAYRVGRNGRPYVLPGTGGICFNVRVGDPAFGWAADNLHPGVAVYHSDRMINEGLNYLACIGNQAVVTSGDATGAEGVVVGKHGFVAGFGLLTLPYLIVDFRTEILDKLSIGDKVQIKSYGRGLEIEGYPHIQAKNCSPELLDALRIEPVETGVLQVPVVSEVPVRLMGEGTDERSERAAQSIMTGDMETIKELGLSSLRLGDIVALLDQDHSYGRSYRPGAITIGVVVHGDSPMAGHGPGVTTLLTCATSRIKPVRDHNANIVRYLGLA
jgi:hypothetical protein